MDHGGHDHGGHDHGSGSGSGAGGAPAPAHGTDLAYCRGSNSEKIEKPGRRLHGNNDGHGVSKDNVFKVREGKCSKWTSLISNYSAVPGTESGTYVRVFSDGSTTAEIDAILSRNGAVLTKTSVMAHLHAGPCSDPGPHWMNDKKEEMHFMFKTKDKTGETEAMSCTSYEVDRKAKSVVLHENDANAVVKMGAKKLCCDLVWDEKDFTLPADTSPGPSSAQASAAVSSCGYLGTTLFAAVLAAVFALN